ncbi:nitroreductase family protein [Streptomyces sp. NPDC003860]
MTDTALQSVPQVLLEPFTGGPVLTGAEAACVAAALTPATRGELLERGFAPELIDSLLVGGLLAPAPAKAGLWHRHGWGRPELLVRAADASRTARSGELPAATAPVAGVLDSREAFEQVLKRRSTRQFDRRPLPAPVLHTVLAAADPLLSAWPHLRLYAAVQYVDGVERGVHAYQGGALTLKEVGLDDTRLRDCAHQYWVLGTGCVLFFVVDWHALEQAHGAGPDAYTTVLTECGRLAHTAVLAANGVGAGTWMTPAIDEQVAAELCGLDSGSEEALYMLKIGMPRNTEDTR